MRKTVLTWATCLALAAAVAMPALGAGGGRGAGGAGGGRGAGGAGGAGGGRGGAPDPAATITNLLAQIRTQMAITDEGEWKVIADKLQKVLEIEQKLAAIPNPIQGGRGGGAGGAGGGGRGGRGGAAGGAPGGAPGAAPGGAAGGGRGGAAVDPNNPLAVAMGALNTTVADAAAKPDDIKPKVSAVRDAHKKLTTDLTAAQADLQKYLSVRQEAILVSRGILD